MSAGENILVMAGAREAHALVAGLLARHRHVVASLPETERSFAPLPVRTRIGAFEGEQAFAAFLAEAAIDVIMDASHPFDSHLSALAAQESRRSDVRYLRVLRTPWTAGADDTWQMCPSIAAAVAAVPRGARIFSNTGRASLAAYQDFRGDHVYFRITRDVDVPSPHEFLTYVPGTPPFSEQEEEDLFRGLAVTHLICRNVGGDASFSKLAAARRLGLPVLMIDRPAAPDGATVVRDVSEALAWEAAG